VFFEIIRQFRALTILKSKCNLVSSTFQELHKLADIWMVKFFHDIGFSLDMLEKFFHLCLISLPKVIHFKSHILIVFKVIAFVNLPKPTFPQQFKRLILIINNWPSSQCVFRIRLLFNQFELLLVHVDIAFV
jgi:hypothetical protein